MQSTEFWLWLSSALGPCAANTANVLAQFPSLDSLLENREEWHRWFSPVQIYALKQTAPRDFRERMEICARLGVRIVTWEDPDYPSQLRTIDSPPPVLYCRGDLSAAAAPLVLGMIGTRRPSAYGADAMKFLSDDLAKAGVVLVSGMADGLDGEAHRASLRADMPTIACLAFGHTHCYPAQHCRLKDQIEQRGLTLSEYPPEVKVQKAFFLQRNRLIAGLSRGVCVVEACAVSGTSNTVRHALDYGRDVFSVPGSIFSPMSAGTNRMLREGAIPVTCAEDILRFYGLERAPHPPQARRESTPSLSPDAQAVRRVLTNRPQTLEAVCSASGLASRQTLAALTELELAGLCRQLAGRQFILKGS